jgi:hypothetical protein
VGSGRGKDSDDETLRWPRPDEDLMVVQPEHGLNGQPEAAATVHHLSRCWVELEHQQHGADRHDSHLGG